MNTYFFILDLLSGKKKNLLSNIHNRSKKKCAIFSDSCEVLKL